MPAPPTTRFVVEYAMLLAALRFARFVWLFDKIMTITDADMVEETSSATVPARDPNWLQRRQRQHDGRA